MVIHLLHSLQIRRDWLAYFPEEADADEGPYALRLHQYKAHFYTKGYVSHVATPSQPSAIAVV